MIITELNGGLGNQMFQYAIGRSLSLKNKSLLKLDISNFNTYKLRKYELFNFCIEENLIESSKYQDAKGIRKIEWFFHKVKNKIIYRNMNYFREKQFCFDQDVLNIGNNTYLSGYWQSEKYFKDNDIQIRKDFLLKTPLSNNSNEIKYKITQAKIPISLHIRRGDYVSNLKTK